jgi:DNA-binding MarR family transcriptional regulator
VRAKTVGKPELLVDGDDAEFRTFIHDFLAFSQMLTDIRAGFGEHLGITGIQYTILITVSHMQGRPGIGVNAIAEHLHLSGAFITTEVAKLVRAGLISKRVNAKDKRRVLLTVTAEGRKLLNKLVAVQAPVNDALFDTLTAEEFVPLKEMMARLVPCAARSLALLAYLTEKDAANRSPGA